MLRRQLTRKQLLPFLARLEPCLARMEACGGGAHYWAREIGRLDHAARLMSPHFVKPYRKSQKNDGNDAEAICEAVGRLIHIIQRHPALLIGKGASRLLILLKLR